MSATSSLTATRGLSVRHRFVVAFYLLSGMAALVYEVAFSKYFAFVFGATALASSAVLVAYMGGLALGAYAASRFDRRVERPLFVYGIAELLIGLFCLLSPVFFAKMGTFYVGLATSIRSPATLTVLRAAIAIVLVLIPTAGAGATLPLLARLIVAEDPVKSRKLLATLYAANTSGGALGSLLSAYVALPALGLAATVRTAAGVGITVGVLSLVLGWKWRVPLAKDTAPPDVTVAAIPRGRILTAAAFSGFLVFTFEVLVVHLLAVIIGTSAYAFGLALFVFLVCLSFGPPLSTWMARRWGKDALFYSLTACAIAIAGGTLLWDRLPLLFASLGTAVRSFAGRELVRATTTFLALVVPVTLMGTTFPLVLRTVRASSAAADTGKLTAANTVGAIIGSLVGGFVLLPNLGSQRSVYAVGLVYAALALLFRPLVDSSRGARPRGLSLLARPYAWLGVAFLLPFILPDWNLARITSGANVYFNEGTVPDGTVEWISEDVHGGVTTVVRDGKGQRFLLTNGKFQGNDSEEVRDNRGLAHLPAVYAPTAERALVIGLGTGTTAGALAAHGYPHIDVAELSPAIVHAARTWFREINANILDDPRVHLHVADGRNLLLTGREPYDLISIEVSSIWFAGAANLYSKDFYAIAKSRLRPEGVLQQWLPLHHTNRRNVATIIGTVRQVFPNVLVFVNGHQGHIVASEHPLTTSREALFALEAQPAMKTQLGGEHLIDYVKGLVLSAKDIDRFLDDTADDLDLPTEKLVSTDDNLYLEYATPKGNVPTSDDIPDTIAYLVTYRNRKGFLSHLTY